MKRSLSKKTLIIIVVVTILAIAIIAIVSSLLLFSHNQPPKDTKAQSSTTVYRPVGQKITVGGQRYVGACSILPASVIKKEVSAFSDATRVSETYLGSSLTKSDLDKLHDHAGTNCTYRYVGVNNIDVKVDVETYATNASALDSWLSSAAGGSVDDIDRMRKIIDDARGLPSVDPTMLSNAERFISSVRDAQSEIITLLHQPRDIDGPPIAYDITTKPNIIYTGYDFAMAKGPRIIHLDTTSDKTTLAGDFRSMDDTSPGAAVIQLDRAARLFKTMSSRLNSPDSLSQSPTTSWPRTSSLNGYEPCDLLDNALFASIGEQPSQFYTQTSTPYNVTIMRPMNGGEYQFPADNTCERSFDQYHTKYASANIKLAIRYPKDTAAAKSHMQDMRSIYQGYPDVVIPGADEAIFSNVRSLSEGGPSTVPAKLVARKGSVVIELTVSASDASYKLIPIKDAYIQDAAKMILKAIE